MCVQRMLRAWHSTVRARGRMWSCDDLLMAVKLHSRIAAHVRRRKEVISTTTSSEVDRAPNEVEPCAEPITVVRLYRRDGEVSGSNEELCLLRIKRP